MRRGVDENLVPPISPILWRWFSWYAPRFLRKHMHAVRLVRGGEALKRTIMEESRIPVIKHFEGICHLYVDARADVAMAERICQTVPSVEKVRLVSSGTEATVADVEEFVLAETAFRETHYKKPVLAELEKAGKLAVVNAKPGRKARSYAEPELKLRFVDDVA